MRNEIFVYDPAVFAVGNDYQIMFYTKEKGAAHVTVGDETFYDTCNGLLRSEDCMHTVTVPQSVLDAAGKYTIGYVNYPDREPYFPTHSEAITEDYNFRPIKEDDGLQIYWLSDTHERYVAPSAAAEYFGDKLDLLLLGGDIGESLTVDQILNIYRISERVTHGEIPVVYVRGNHDLRGKYGEIQPKYAPTDDGRVYFTFRVGSIWGIILDCGEDKIDDSTEYGGVSHFTPFRRDQVTFVNKVLKNADEEFAAEGVKHRIALCHIPFTDWASKNPQFSQIWAREYYNEWCVALNQMNIDIMLTGHMHKVYTRTAEEQKALDVSPNFPLVVGSVMSDMKDGKKVENGDEFTGCALEIIDGKINVKFTNSKKQIVADIDM